MSDFAICELVDRWRQKKRMENLQMRNSQIAIAEIWDTLMSKCMSDSSFFIASIILLFVSPDPHGLGGPLLAPLDSYGGPLDMDPLSAWVFSLGVA
jgi:hypothetical protein